MRIKACFVISVAVLMVLAAISGVWARPADDGFSSAKEVRAQYFTISLAPGVDEESIIRSLDISPTHKILAGKALNQPNTVGNLVDALFLWAGGVLDMQLYNYKGSIKVVRNAAALSDVYRKLYGMNNHGEKSFYIFEINTIYIAATEVTKEILGHEIGHAIICNFFVVPPPAKVQEVLAGYIEYQLRKGATRR